MSLHTVSSTFKTNGGPQQLQLANAAAERLIDFDKNALNPVSTGAGFPCGAYSRTANKNNRYAWGPDNLNFGSRALASRTKSPINSSRAASAIVAQPTP